MLTPQEKLLRELAAVKNDHSSRRFAISMVATYRRWRCLNVLPAGTPTNVGHMLVRADWRMLISVHTQVSLHPLRPWSWPKLCCKQANRGLCR